MRKKGDASLMTSCICSCLPFPIASRADSSGPSSISGGLFCQSPPLARFPLVMGGRHRFHCDLRSRARSRPPEPERRLPKMALRKIFDGIEEREITLNALLEKSEKEHGLSLTPPDHAQPLIDSTIDH